MKAGGLTIGVADLVVLNYPAMLTALGSGALDVAMLSEPQATVAAHHGWGVKWKSYSDVVGSIQQTVLIFSPSFAAESDVATRWMTAYLRGGREYNDAFVKNIHRPQTANALAAALGITPALFDD